MTGRVRRRAELLALVAVVVATVAVRVPALGQPLLEKHAFRQTQTAYQALVFDEQGIDLLHPKLPVLGAPFEVPFEFPLFQALAVVPMKLGAGPDLALRLTGLACFLLTALLLYGLVRRLAGRPAAFAALLAFVASPFDLVWSRTSMIEYLATVGAVGYAWAGIAWRDTRRPELGALALGAGLVAMLVKITTGLFWILPLLGYRTAREGRGLHSWARERLRPGILALVGLPLLAALAWTRHADSIKESSPTTAFLTSRALRTFDFGTLDQRLDLGTWLVIGKRAELYLAGVAWVLLPVALVATARSRQRLFWIGVVVAAGLPPLVFTNLYWLHDYYLAAVTPAVAAVLGLGAGWLWERRPQGYGTAAAALGGALLVAVSLATTRGYWTPIYRDVEDPESVLPLAREIDAATRADDLVAVAGKGWSPAVLYYARRRGQMLPQEVLDLPDFAGRLRAQGYHVLASPNAGEPIDYLRRWPWVGALGPHLYSLAESPAGLRGARVLATTARTLPAGKVLTTTPATIRCDSSGTTIATGARATWLALAASPREARIRVDGLAPLPVRPVEIVVSATGRLRVGCTGAGAVTIRRAVDAPPPAGAAR